MNAENEHMNARDAWIADASTSIARMVARYVEDGLVGGTNWHNGLAEIIELRLRRFAPPVEPDTGMEKALREKDAASNHVNSPTQNAPAFRYVVGFIFDFAFERVALIRKQKPAWQAGLLNGLGGKIELGETPPEAMRREFIEESGVDAEWHHYCNLSGTNNDGAQFSLDCFWSQGALQDLVSQEAEQIEILTLTKVIARRHEMIGNLPWHLELARDFACGVFPPRFVKAEYGPSVGARVSSPADGKKEELVGPEAASDHGEHVRQKTLTVRRYGGRIHITDANGGDVFSFEIANLNHNNMTFDV